MIRALLGASLLALSACGQSAAPLADAPTPAATVAAAPLTLDCATFPVSTSAASLEATYGAANVTHETVPGPEGTEDQATVLFSADPAKRLEIIWNDAAGRSQPGAVSVVGASSAWVGPHGIKLGDTVAAVEAANGRVFGISGFDWDYGGTVMDWMEGALADRDGCHVLVRFNPRASSAGAAGDARFESDSAGVRAADPVVSTITIGYPAE